MSTNLKPTANFYLTQFYGGEGRGRCLQITEKIAKKDAFIPNHIDYLQLTVADAMGLAEALIQFANGTRPEDE